MGEENLDCPINVFDSESMEVEERNSRTARPDDGGETEERIIYGVEDVPLPHLTVVFALQVRCSCLFIYLRVGKFKLIQIRNKC